MTTLSPALRRAIDEANACRAAYVEANEALARNTLHHTDTLEERRHVGRLRSRLWVLDETAERLFREEFLPWPDPWAEPGNGVRAAR